MTAPISSAAPAAEKVAETVAKNADDAAAVVAKTGLRGTGLIGLGAGAAGILVTVMDAWREAQKSGTGFDTGSLLGPTTFSILIGGGAMALAETGKIGGRIGVGMRTGGAALVLGGLVGAVAGALTSRNDPLGDELRASSLVQGATRFDQELPAVAADLEGVQIATADVIAAGRSLEQHPMYIDTASAEQVDVETLGDAIGLARAAAQADDGDRGHAVLQARDGAFWIARLDGAVDNVDGKGYDVDNEFDRRYPPTISKRQPALRAIVGVETRWTFPLEMSATAAAPDAGTIPWVTPELDGSSTTREE